MSIHRIPSPALVVLAGPAGAGKSTWAESNFRPEQIVSSDRLRAMVGASERDQSVSAEAFELLETLLQARVGRRLTTVVDSMGFDSEARTRWREMAVKAGMASIVVIFDTAPGECRRRNAARPRSVPVGVLDQQLKRWKTVRSEIESEDFDITLTDPGQVRLVPAAMAGAASNAAPQLRFDLQVATFGWADGDDSMADRLTKVAVAAEEVGFGRLWLMDHLRQIPQVGSAWDPIIEPYTALSFLAGRTTSIGLGAMVTNVALRPIGHLAQELATLDVLSGGRAVCGLGAGWFRQEMEALGIDFASDGERLDALEDALQVLPLFWGPGSPPFEGKTLTVSEALCYPRPLQDTIPMVVGGGGERRTLRLVAEHADACNLIGDVSTIRRKLEVLDRHCSAIGRDRSEIEVTVLAPTLHDEADTLDDRLANLAPANVSTERFAERVGAGTTEEQVNRFAALAEMGVDTIVVTMPTMTGPDEVAAFAAVIEAFR